MKEMSILIIGFFLGFTAAANTLHDGYTANSVLIACEKGNLSVKDCVNDRRETKNTVD